MARASLVICETPYRMKGGWRKESEAEGGGGRGVESRSPEDLRSGRYTLTPRVESSRQQKGSWIWPVIVARIKPPSIIGDLRLFREGMPREVLRETAKAAIASFANPLSTGSWYNRGRI